MCVCVCVSSLYMLEVIGFEFEFLPYFYYKFLKGYNWLNKTSNTVQKI